MSRFHRVLLPPICVSSYSNPHWHYLQRGLYCIIHAFRSTHKFRPAITMTLRSSVLVFLTLFTVAGCGLIYKQNIQQGNALEQEELDELYIGMNQRQVLFVLGTPSIKDPFQPDRWDYVQTFSRRGGELVQRTVTLRFEDGLLSEITGQENPFGPSAAQTSGSAGTASGAVASFVKKPDASPQDASLESAEEEVLGKKSPDIETVPERSAEDRDYQKDQDVLDQTPRDGPTGPDIDG
jgi:outer membrane protein assembly factor BamE (lipoprotein component of BamABCDE complex)